MSTQTHHAPHQDTFNLDTVIDHIAHWLPSQGPLKDFIHHNTLHAVQDRPFHEGIALAAKIYGAKNYLPLADYQQRYREGRINRQALDWAIAQAECSAAEEQNLRNSLFEPDHHSHYPPPSLANHGIRSSWLTHLEIDLNALVHPLIFRLLSNFLDQGISRWALPKAGESFWDCVLRLTQNSLLPLYPFHQTRVRDMLNAGPDQVIMNALDRIVGDESLYAQYLLEVLLTHPGWSGMVRIIETQPQTLLAPRSISLKQLLAVELACELAFIDKKRAHDFIKVCQLPNLNGLPLLEQTINRPNVPLKMRVWHEAMEWSLHSELLAALRIQPPATAPEPHPPKVQAVFCIDDRECSLRRHLEELDVEIDTYGAPGFFGIDFLYQGLEDAYPVAQCPAVIKPRHLILESSTSAA